MPLRLLWKWTDDRSVTQDSIIEFLTEKRNIILLLKLCVLIFKLLDYSDSGREREQGRRQRLTVFIGGAEVQTLASWQTLNLVRIHTLTRVCVR